MTVHEQPVSETVEWYTPRSLFDALGVRFDLDVAAPRGGVPWVPADRYLTIDDNALMAPWTGRVWLNPPYGPIATKFLHRMSEHGNGIALVASRTETRAWQRTALSADLTCFLRDRLYFVRADGFTGRSSHASTLFAWGADCVGALARSGLGSLFLPATDVRAAAWPDTVEAA